MAIGARRKPTDSTATVSSGPLATASLAPASVTISIPGNDRLQGERFRVLAQLGEGGMGRVYRAYDTLLSREVAIKVLHEDKLHNLLGQARMFREARVMAALHHPGLVELHDVDPERGVLVMELIDGESLRDLIKRGAALEPGELRRLADQLLDALAALHAGGMVHRDVKPSNLIVDRGGRLRLIDFGIAHVADSEMTVTGEVLGTPQYMSPEQHRGESVGPPTDVYAAAVTIFELATGRRPALGLDPARAAALVEEAGHDRPLALAVGRALRIDPSQRFPDAATFRAALAAPHRRVPMWLAGVAIIAVVGAALGVARLRSSETEPVAATATSPRFTDPTLRRSFATLLHSIAQGELDAAYDVVDQLLAAAPDDPAVLYQSILVNLWREQPEAVVRDLADRAMRTPRTPLERALIQGVVAVTERDFARASATFRSALASAPNDRDLRYALFEALWHAGDVEGAVAIYVELVRDFDTFRFGDAHLLSYYVDRRDREGLRYLAAGKTRMSRGRLEATSAMALGGAAAVVDDPHMLSNLKPYERALVLAMAGRPEAEDARRSLDGPDLDPRSVVARLGLAVAADDLVAIDQLAGAVETTPGELLWQSRMSMEEVAMLASSPQVPMRLVNHARAELERRHGAHRSANTELARALLAWRQQDRALLSQLSRHPAAEVAAVATGLRAELDGDLATASTQLDRALATASDGRFRFPERHHRARLARLAGDHDTVRRACETILAPNAIEIGWTAVAGNCRTWLAESR